jgi:hypothetical protein
METDPKSFPGSAQYVTLQNVSHMQKLSYLLFCNPAPKTKTDTANTWEVLLANHLD